MLGSFGNTLGNRGMDAFRAPPHSEAAPRQSKKQQQQLIDGEWSELPYAMMRLTAARRPWEANRVYWRDRNVQLGEIDLHLHRNRTRAQDDVPRYTVTYSHEGLRRDFSLHPSIQDDQLRWTSPGICDTARLTTDQLAEKLLSKLVVFYTRGFS